MKRVVITGLGAVTPIGTTIKSYWDGIVNCRSGADLIQSFDTTNFPVHFACEARDFNPDDYFDKREQRRLDPFAQLGLVVSDEAIEDSGLDLQNDSLRQEIGCIFGTGIGGLHEIESTHSTLLEKGPRRVSPFLVPKMMTNAVGGQIAIRHGIQGPNFSVSSACASSSHAIITSYMVIRMGEAKAVVTGGSEAAITPLGLSGFCSAKALSRRNDDPATASRPFSLDRDGFVMGEGAGALVLEEYEHAKKRGASIYAEIVGIGMTDDAFHITAPSEDGGTAALCMTNALKHAGLTPENIDYINAHGTSTRYNDSCETQAIKKAFGDYAYKLAVSSNKSQTGHLLGASSAIEAIATVLGMQNSIVPATINYTTADPDCDLDYVPNTPRPMEIKYALSNSLGFGGHNGAIVFKKV